MKFFGCFQKEISASRKCRLDDTFEPWSMKKAAILNKYTTSEKLSIATSFLSGGEKSKYLESCTLIC